MLGPWHDLAALNRRPDADGRMPSLITTFILAMCALTLLAGAALPGQAVEIGDSDLASPPPENSRPDGSKQRDGYWWRGFQPWGLDLAYGHPGHEGATTMTKWGHNKLVVGGFFQEAGGLPANYIALWDGIWWEILDEGLNWEPNVVYDYGTAVIAAGHITHAGGQEVNNIATWDGMWHPMGNPGGIVHDICEHSGSIWLCGGTPLARWTGSHWEVCDWGYCVPDWPVGSRAYALCHFGSTFTIGGNFYFPETEPETHALIQTGRQDPYLPYIPHYLDSYVYCMEQTSPTSLYLGGSFCDADGVISCGLVNMGPSGFFYAVAQPDEPRRVYDLIEHGGGLYVATEHEVRQYIGGPTGHWHDPLGGRFHEDNLVRCLGSCGDLFAGGTLPGGIVRWHADQWVQLGGGLGRGEIDGHYINDLVNYDGGMVACGMITLPGVLEGGVDYCYNVAFWDGEAWLRMGTGTYEDINALCVYQDNVIAGGDYFAIGGQLIDNIASWDGDAWQDIGGVYGRVSALTVHDGELIAGGYFNSAGGNPANRIAAWSGTTWRALGEGTGIAVLALATYRGDLIAAGSFTEAGGAPASRIARWDGSEWHPLGTGLDGDVHSLAKWRGDLYVGGTFQNAGGSPARYIARWDGSEWHPVGAGVGGAGVVEGVTALQATTDDLYVGGDFTEAGGAPAGGIAIWDGASWSELSSGVSSDYNTPQVNALLVRNGDLYLGGHFFEAGTRPSRHIARWVDGTITPTLLRSFKARPSGDNTGRAVEIHWSVTAATVPTAFRLTARADRQQWSVPLEGVAGAGASTDFTVRDASPLLATADQVSYNLLHRGNDADWHTVASRTITLPAPASTVLTGAFPNPFNPQTEISFALDHPQRVRLAIYALTGRLVATLADAQLPAGNHKRTWNGLDAQGREVASGVYLVRLVTDKVIQSAKVMLVR